MIIFSQDGTMNNYIYLVRLVERQLESLSGVSSIKRGNP